MIEITSFDCSRIAQDLQIRKVQVEAVVQLFDEGNTVPFITRYRKERTGGLNEEVIRQIQTRIGLLRQLAERKQTILKSLESQGKLTRRTAPGRSWRPTPSNGWKISTCPTNPRRRHWPAPPARTGPRTAGPGRVEPGRRRPQP